MNKCVKKIKIHIIVSYVFCKDNMQKSVGSQEVLNMSSGDMEYLMRHLTPLF